MKLARLLTAAAIWAFASISMAQEPSSAPLGTSVLASQDGNWEVRSLGKDVYVFRWNPDFYQSLFVTSSDETLVVDPLGSVVAPHYRAAVRQITAAPITKIVYSHSHVDHIAGAKDLAPNAEIISHLNAKSRIIARGDAGILIPTRTVGNGDEIRVGEKIIHVHYFGPTHSDSLIALTVDSGVGRLLVFVDAIEPGIPPYRTMSDFSVDGYLAALAGASRLGVDAVMGGHTGPAPGAWVTLYHHYASDLLAATREAWDQADKSTRQGEDGIHATERVIAETTRAAAEKIRSKYSGWRGYDVWAPLNAQRMLEYIQTGD